MAGTGGGGDEEMISGINVTPLVDVVLVLLVILMVTATAIVSKTIPMEQPEASTAESTEANDIAAISVDSKGKLYLDKDKVTMEQLRARIKKAKAGNPDLKVLIAADKSVMHGRVIEVMDVLRQEKIAKLAFSASPPEKKK